MGTSGPGIFADDVAADVRDEYTIMVDQETQTVVAWEEYAGQTGQQR